MLRIYIKTTDWKEVDFNDVNLALNDSMLNITNPIKMSTEYSKTISFPLTAHNRDVFNHYERLDSLVTSSLDPSKAIPARVECDGNIVFEGYFALTNVDLGNARLEGNLYSYINVWVNRMKNLTWDDFPSLLPDDLKIDRFAVYTSWVYGKNRHGSTPGLTSYGKELYVSTTDRLLQDGEYVPSVLYKSYWKQHIGFAPTVNGTPAQFDNSKIVGATSDTTAAQTIDVWNGMSNFLGHVASTPVADGLSEAQINTATSILGKPSERQMLQFRSYNQKPFIFVNWLCKLIEWYCDNTEDMPSLEFDPEWTVYDNPNWHDLVYVLPDILKEDSEAVMHSNIYTVSDIEYDSATTNSMPNNNNVQTHYSTGLEVTTEDDTTGTIISNDGWIIGGGKSIDYILPVSAKANFSFYGNYSNYDEGTTEAEAHNACNIYWNKKVILIGTVQCYAGLVDQNGTKIAGTEKLVKQWLGGSNVEVQTTKTITNTSQYGRRETFTWSLSANETYTWSGTLTADKARPYFEWRFKNRTNTWSDWYESYNTASMTWTPDITGMDDYQSLIMYYLMPKLRDNYRYGFETDGASQTNNNHRLRYADAARSGKKITMKDLWYTENENSIFNVFLKYLKMMNLVLVYDNFSNKLEVLPREKWMEQGFNSGIEDWTGKVDFGKEISFKPLNWEDRYVELNYEKVDLDKMKDFNDKYGYTYGTKRIGTSYSFNSNTKKLLEDNDAINVSGEMTEYQYNMWQVKDIVANFEDPTHLQEPILPDESLPINRKTDKAANIENCFFYYRTDCYTPDSNVYNCQLPSWDNSLNKLVTESNWNYIAITDDCQYETNNGTYCFQPVFRKTYTQIQNPYWSGTVYNYDGNDVKAVRVNTTLNKPTLTHYIEKWTKYTDIFNEETVITHTQYCCLFALPREDYFNPNAVIRNSNDLWTVRWSNLIPELYNEQNKLLTCKVYLTPKDYNQFKFNKFIYINNVLYLVNKIIDYNPVSTEATKVELIQVMNPQAYITSPLINSTTTRTTNAMRREIEEVVNTEL